MLKDGEKLAANILQATNAPYLTKMKLMKLAFLVEYEALRKLGHRLSHIPFKTDRFGVVCYDTVNCARDSVLIQAQSTWGLRYGRQTRLSLRRGAAVPPYESEEQQLLRSVVEEYDQKYNADQLGAKTKQIVGYEPWNENIGTELDMEVIVMENDPEFRSRLEQLSECRPGDYEDPIPIEEFRAALENH